MKGGTLRSAHAVVRVVLAATFAAKAVGAAAESLVPVLDLTALATYLVFLITRLSTRRG